MDYQDTPASTNYTEINHFLVNDNGPTTGAEIVRIYEAFTEVYSKIDEFVKMCALLKAEKWANGNDYQSHAFGHKKKFRYFIVVKRNYYRRMMFCVSGHLPWRDRKRLKDR